ARAVARASSRLILACLARAAGTSLRGAVLACGAVAPKLAAAVMAAAVRAIIRVRFTFIGLPFVLSWNGPRGKRVCAGVLAGHYSVRARRVPEGQAVAPMGGGQGR